MAYESSTTYLLTRLPYAGLYYHNGRQMELCDKFRHILISSYKKHNII